MSALPLSIASPPVIGPVPGQERIEAIDILRGVAILGILIVNMDGFSLPEDLLLLTQCEAWRRRLAPLATVGRMALSNYLLQSLICTMIFYSYGLALFCKVRPSLGLLFTIVIFLVQIPLSVWWLRRFQFGPIEWLWRSLTYWQRQPMRVAEPQ